jgi:hypothetical protein
MTVRELIVALQQHCNPDDKIVVHDAARQMSDDQGLTDDVMLDRVTIPGHRFNGMILISN